MTNHEKEKSMLDVRERIENGGGEKYRNRVKSQNKMLVRERLDLLFDEGSLKEEWIFAKCLDPSLAADAIITGLGKINGRKVAFLAADPTVKAGSWGEKSVEKMIRTQELAMKLKIPMLYMIDSAGGRITDQIKIFPGYRHSGKIFYNMIKMSGMVPQICINFGPSPAGSAYIPSFADFVVMVDKNASAYLGSTRMVEMVIGEKVTMEEMGGARLHCSTSGLGDVLAKDERDAIEITKKYLSYMPQNYKEKVEGAEPALPKMGPSIKEIIPKDMNRPFDMVHLIERVVDENSWFEIKELFAQELVVGFGRMDGKTVGIVANQPKVKGGTLFVDSADKGARFVTLCNAFNIPLLFLADVPGYMVGSAVEKKGIIRHGAKMLTAVSEATVPKMTVIVRKCYGAGLYAMCGPAYDPETVIALPSASIAIMGPEAAINAVYYNKIQELPEEERQEYILQKREEYSEDINIYALGSEMIINEIIPFDQLRDEVIERFDYYSTKDITFGEKKCPVHPV
ncbi:acyl-CoA carboxylase subunit beta [Alkalihalobacterium alkalinitrilicum]|uniref:acyl-CoA carboxylase subunit beta n=1 Tax=Alkalihalobacterium alkalinitrilicum TaxID=427920 RepID=UPI00147504D7|nr:acyl-CoA carboxylase subunit beta [Alkalihalobacterium alkalinitrilicum]